MLLVANNQVLIQKRAARAHAGAAMAGAQYQAGPQYQGWGKALYALLVGGGRRLDGVRHSLAFVIAVAVFGEIFAHQRDAIFT